METPKKWQVGYPKNRMSHRVQLQPSIWSAAALLQSTPFIKIHVGNPKPPKPQGGAPPNYKWVIIPLSIDISPINHSEMGLINQLS